MNGLLVSVNGGVLFLFFYQTWIAIFQGPSANKLKIQKKLATKIVTQIMEKQRGRILAAVNSLAIDMPPEQASAIESAVVSVLGRLPMFIAQMDAIDGVVESVKDGTAFTEPWDLIDSVIKIAKKVNKHTIISATD